MIGFVLAGLMLTALASAFVMLASGMSLAEMMEMGQRGTMDFTPALTRVLLTTQHLLTFIIPGLAFGLVFYGSKLLIGLDLAVSPGLPLTLLGVFFLMAAYPLVNLSYLVNEAIPLPAWATALKARQMTPSRQSWR